MPRDYAEAGKWYRLAAEQGETMAQFNLALLDRPGQGVGRDYAQSHLWFDVVALVRHPESS